MHYFLELLSADVSVGVDIQQENVYYIKHTILRFLKSSVDHQEKEISNIELIKETPILSGILSFYTVVIENMDISQDKTKNLIVSRLSWK